MLAAAGHQAESFGVSPILVAAVVVVAALAVATVIAALRPRGRAITRIWDARHHTAMDALARLHAVPARGASPVRREPEPVPDESGS